MKNYEIIDADVVVLGGGTSGIFLALYLVSKGFRVALVEKTQKLGGALANNLVYPTAGFHTPNFKYVYSPLVDEFLRELEQKKFSLGHIKDPLNFSSTITPLSTTSYKLLTSKLLEHNNFYFFPLSTIKQIKSKDYKIDSLFFNSYGKNYKAKGKIFVDASGILISSYFLPIEYYFDLENTQAMSLIFKVSNVDFNLILRDLKNNPQEFYHKTDPELIKSQKFLSVSGYFSLAKRYLNNQSLLLSRDRFLFFSYIDKNSVIVNTTRLFLKDLIKPEKILNQDTSSIEYIEKTSYKILLKQVFYIHSIMREHIDGFKNSYISEIADYVGIRQYRNVKGNYTLTFEDIIKGNFFEDTISIGTWPIDIHISNSIIEKRINENGYGIPFRCCINNYKNLIFIGKNISADRYAFSSCRIQASLMILGENMGRILEFCLENKINPTDLDYKHIKKTVKVHLK